MLGRHANGSLLGMRTRTSTRMHLFRSGGRAGEQTAPVCVLACRGRLARYGTVRRGVARVWRCIRASHWAANSFWILSPSRSMPTANADLDVAEDASTEAFPTLPSDSV